MSKAITKEYLLKQLKGFDMNILENKYVFKFATMPTASAKYEGIIAQYVGQTDSNYVRSYFYDCVKSGDDASATYSWVMSGSSDSVSIAKKTTAEDGFAATYYLKNDRTGDQMGASINIPKDWLLKSAELKTCTVNDSPEQGFVAGDKYIEFGFNTYANGDGKTETVTYIYLNVTDLFDDYKGGAGIDISVNDSGEQVISVDITTDGGLKFSDMAPGDTSTLEVDFEATNLTFDYSTWDSVSAT